MKIILCTRVHDAHCAPGLKKNNPKDLNREAIRRPVTDGDWGCGSATVVYRAILGTPWELLLIREMAAIRMTTNILVNGVSQSAFRALSSKHIALPFLRNSTYTNCQKITTSSIRCSASSQYGDAGKKASARLSQVQQLLLEAEERSSASNESPPPKISLEHVIVNFARSGGPGGQNVNKVNTKVDMRFNVKNATWLSERVREKIMQLEKNRINKDGEIVITSTKTRTQQGNIEDALAKLQAIIDTAAYVPPPPTEEQKKKIAQLSAKSEQKRLQNKKVLSQKKSIRRNKGSWD
ncbi:Peptidyl-tRNA hydrolase ICT1 mitochondrial [Bienertia sinuspersici]